MLMKIRLLGPTTIMDHAKAVRIRAPKRRQLLAVLALRPGRVVSTDRITDELWGATPPRSASTAVQTYVYQLRKAIRTCLGGRVEEKDLLATVAPGYVLHVHETDVDAFRLRDEIETA